MLKKDEFLILVLLYAANIDGVVHSEEINLIMQKFGANEVSKVQKMYAKMSDNDILDNIAAHKNLYASTLDGKKSLVAELNSIIQSDGTTSVMESQLIRTINKLLK